MVMAPTTGSVGADLDTAFVYPSRRATLTAEHYRPSSARVTVSVGPVAPGEKVLVTIDRDRKSATLHPHDEMVRIAKRRWLERTGIG